MRPGDDLFLTIDHALLDTCTTRIPLLANAAPRRMGPSAVTAQAAPPLDALITVLGAAVSRTAST
ncbi:hypothetical protein EAO68_13170 [Streptomyces sp. wa22]|nr:hypothetical protein EAO68_13170 [Streptomyces sp. wa22]